MMGFAIGGVIMGRLLDLTGILGPLLRVRPCAALPVCHLSFFCRQTGDVEDQIIVDVIVEVPRALGDLAFGVGDTQNSWS
jgi:hypothetical protein